MGGVSLQGDGPWNNGAEGGCGYVYGHGAPARMEGCSQGFFDSDFRSREDQAKPGYPLLLLMPMSVLVVESVLLLLVIGCLDVGV